MGVPYELGHTITGRTLQSLRGYFVGVTAVAVFNAVVIGLGALVLDVPQLGAIVVINFVAAYIPYLGAWSAGAFTVLVALGSKGSSTALIMAVIVLLANGVLQQMIQPIAYGAALGIHPLAVLIVTLAGGALFGGIGLILARAAHRGGREDLRRRRAGARGGSGRSRSRSPAAASRRRRPGRCRDGRRGEAPTARSTTLRSARGWCSPR